MESKNINQHFNDINKDETSSYQRDNILYMTQNSFEKQIEIYKNNYIEAMVDAEQINNITYDTRTEREIQRTEDLLNNVYNEGNKNDSLHVINSDFKLKINPNAEARIQEIDNRLQKLREEDNSNMKNNQKSLCIKKDMNIEELYHHLWRVDKELMKISKNTRMG